LPGGPVAKLHNCSGGIVNQFTSIQTGAIGGINADPEPTIDIKLCLGAWLTNANLSIRIELVSQQPCTAVADQNIARVFTDHGSLSRYRTGPAYALCLNQGRK
jgi:hypothetical protein